MPSLEQHSCNSLAGVYCGLCVGSSDPDRGVCVVGAGEQPPEERGHGTIAVGLVLRHLQLDGFYDTCGRTGCGRRKRLLKGSGGRRWFAGDPCPQPPLGGEGIKGVCYQFWWRLLSNDDTLMIHVDTCIIGAKCIISYYRVLSLITCTT